MKSNHETVLDKLGLTKEDYSNLVSRIPTVEAFPADWYDPKEDEYYSDPNVSLCLFNKRRSFSLSSAIIVVDSYLLFSNRAYNTDNPGEVDINILITVSNKDNYLNPDNQDKDHILSWSKSIEPQILQEIEEYLKSAVFQFDKMAIDISKAEFRSDNSFDYGLDIRLSKESLENLRDSNFKNNSYLSYLLESIRDRSFSDKFRDQIDGWLLDLSRDIEKWLLETDAAKEIDSKLKTNTQKESKPRVFSAPCAWCNEIIEVTWSDSCEGHQLFHSDCYDKYVASIR